MALGSLFPVLTSNRSGERADGGERVVVMPSEGGAIRGNGSNIGISGSNSSITMQRIVCEGKGNGEEQRADVLREKERSGRERKGMEGRGGRPTSEERRRDRGLAQKRANVDKIGGGSLQLLAGMSGNAWDSILKARPRQSPLSPPIVPSPTSTATP